MRLSNDLITQFAKLTKTEKQKRETTSYGTIVEDGGTTYVRLDGSSMLTPISTTVAMAPGERVTVMIKNHIAIVTGNITSPSARNVSVTTLQTQVDNLVEPEALTNLEIEDLINSVV